MLSILTKPTILGYLNESAGLLKLSLQDAHVIVFCLAMDNEYCAVNLRDDEFGLFRKFAPKAPRILVGTKIDLREELAANPEKKVPIRNPSEVSLVRLFLTLFLLPDKMPATYKQ